MSHENQLNVFFSRFLILPFVRRQAAKSPRVDSNSGQATARAAPSSPNIRPESQQRNSQDADCMGMKIQRGQKRRIE